MGKQIVSRVRCGKMIVTFDQSIVPIHFFNIARSLGYRIATTGGNTLTHEIEASESDFRSICDLAAKEPAPTGILPKAIDRNTSVIRDLMPTMRDIPREFHDHHNVYAKLVSQWFFSGLKASALITKPGIDRRAALNHLAEIQQSWEPAHEHKSAAVAYLMSLWFDIA